MPRSIWKKRVMDKWLDGRSSVCTQTCIDKFYNNNVNCEFHGQMVALKIQKITNYTLIQITFVD